MYGGMSEQRMEVRAVVTHLVVKCIGDADTLSPMDRAYYQGADPLPCDEELYTSSQSAVCVVGLRVQYCRLCAMRDLPRAQNASLVRVYRV